MPTAPVTPLDRPAFGAPRRHTGDKGCRRGCPEELSCGGRCDTLCGSQPSPVGRPNPDGVETPWTPAHPSSQPLYGCTGVETPLETSQSALQALQQLVLEPLAPLGLGDHSTGSPGDCGPRAGGGWRVLPGSHLLLFQMQPPAAGPIDPLPLFTYIGGQVSILPQYDSAFGFGWKSAYSRSVGVVDESTADVGTGTWTVYRYTGLGGATGYYTPPGDAANSLKKETVGWTETQPDGTTFRYDANGALQYLRNAAGARWTTTYDSDGRLSSIRDPFGRRTTLAFDANNKIKRLQDAGGRITTFTVTGGNLVRGTNPNLSWTSMIYDGHRLKTWVTPGGQRTTFVYDIQLRGMRVSMTSGVYSDLYTNPYIPGPTAGIDPKGRRITYTVSSGRVTSVVSAAGQVTYSWDDGRLRYFSDELGRRTSLTYLTVAADNTKRLYTVGLPSGGKMTFSYDSNGKVRSFLDELGRRTSLVWDGNGDRIAVVNPSGDRTSYSYNAQGQVAAVLSPLGQRCSTVYDASGLLTADVNPLGQRLLTNPKPERGYARDPPTVPGCNRPHLT